MHRQRLDLVYLQQSKKFQEQDEKIQKLIQNLSQGQKTFGELKDLIQIENEKTREYLDVQFRERETRLAEEEYRTRFLESLWFPEILSREETIVEAHSETFQWIFDSSGRAVRPWDNFITWLERSGGTYWISGKAGSGKSTLMSFLCQNEKTIDALASWSGTKDIVMPRFYFWSGGKPMQKSLEGLLRSLLWQILQEFPEITLLPSDVGPRPEPNRKTSSEHGAIGAWTKRRLQRALQVVIDQLQKSCCLCFFLDGLDEFNEDEDDLIALVQSILSTTGVKVCLSSRPYKLFEDTFGSSAKLRLQDLTYRDIQRYVADEFQRVPQLRSMTSMNEYEMSELKDQIVRRAEGIFLWVSLAVKDQIRGLRNDDSPEQLQQRLDCLPSEIEGIYLRMLLQISKHYRQEASSFLRLALYKTGMSLWEHALASSRSLDNMLLSTDTISKGELALLCRSTRKRIVATCAGLLEVQDVSIFGSEDEVTRNWSNEPDDQRLNTHHDDDPSDTNSESETLVEVEPEPKSERRYLEQYSTNPKLGSRSTITDAVRNVSRELGVAVNFIHRTALDFLQGLGPGGDFLEANLSPDFDAQVLDIKISLMEARLNYNGRQVDVIMEKVAFAESRSGTAQTRLCDLVDHSMSVVHNQQKYGSSTLHWSTRWSAHLLREFPILKRLYSKTRADSRPSSRDSFYSALSEPVLYHDLAVADTEHADLPQFDFLGYAALCGLFHYVHQKLGCRGNTLDPETANYLLGYSTLCSHIGHSTSSQDTGRLRLVADLLKRGANPNAYFLTSTIWEGYLKRMFSTYQLSRTDYATMPDTLRVHLLSAFMDFTAPLIEHGADVNAIMTDSLHIYGHSPDTEFEPRLCEFDVQLSAMSVIESCLKDHAQLPHVQEMCVARGAILHSRCITLQFKWSLLARSTGHKDLFGKYDLSEQESKKFLRWYEQHAAHRWNSRDSLRLERTLGRRDSEFFDWLDGFRLDETKLHPSTSPTSSSSSYIEF